MIYPLIRLNPTPTSQTYKPESRLFRSLIVSEAFPGDLDSFTRPLKFRLKEHILNKI